MPAPFIKFGLDVSKAPRHLVASLEPIIRFFSYHNAHPIALGMVCLEKFGYEWLEWEPEVLKKEIISAFRATAVSTHNWQKIQAFKTLLISTSPWTEYDVFENVVLALNNVIPDPGVVQKCSVAQLLAGVDMINQIREEELSRDVCGYIASAAIDEGVTWLPDELSCANETLSEPTYRCLDCGNVDTFDGPTAKDVRCDVCCDRFRDGKEFDGKPNPRLPKECGGNIRVFLKRDPGGIPKLYEKWRSLESADVDEEDPEQLQAAKLVVAYKYMLQRRKELLDQLEELKSWVTH